MSRIDELLAKLPYWSNRIQSLKHQRAHTRLSAKLTRRNLLDRIRAAEKRYDEIYREILRLDPSIGIGNMYRPKQNKAKGAVNVTVEISLDGLYYSNPAPAVPANSTIYVRAIIDDSHKGPSGEPEVHEMAFLKWTIGKGYTKLDNVKSGGHVVYFVSNPLVIIRKFKAPGSNTRKNFLVYVDVYEQKNLATTASGTEL